MRRVALALCILATGWPAAAQESAPSHAHSVAAAPVAVPTRLSFADQERFLLDARISKVKGVSKGTTGTRRATLFDGAITHDASIQSVDESKARFETARRLEFNFRDYWGYNIAAYRLGVMLGLDMIPPSVLRRYQSQEAAFTWWVDDVMMDELGRQKAKVSPPDAVPWTAQVHILRVFDELIANTDRNQGNMLIDTRWKLWLIDHSRAFRTTTDLRGAQIVRRCERTLLEKMKGLTLEGLQAELDEYLTDSEMRSILARRDKLVVHIDKLGPAALYDFVAK